MSGLLPSDLGALVALPIGEIAFAVVDVETTGLYPDRGDRICEVAVVQMTGSREETRWSALVNPLRGMSAGARGISGIDGRTLSGAPRFEDIARELTARLKGRVLVAHNAPFVVGFLRAELAPLGWDLTGAAVVDTRALRRGTPDAPGAIPPLPEPACHRALPDALAVASLLQAQTASLGPDEPLSVLLPRPGDAHLRSPDPFGNVLLRIEEAIERSADLDIRYFSPWNASVTRRRVAPLSLLDDYYLDAFCRLRNARRRFRIDRIRSARLVKAVPTAVAATS